MRETQLILVALLMVITTSCTCIRDKWVATDTSPCIMQWKADARQYGRDWVDANTPNKLKPKSCAPQKPQPREQDLIIPTWVQTSGGTSYRLADPYVQPRQVQAWKATKLNTSKIDE